MKPILMYRAAAALIAAGGLLAAPAWALAATPHAHGHGHATAASQPAGKRWATDAPLREGMERIRAALAPHLAAAHRDQLPPAQYRQIAAQTDTEVAYIVAHCKLQPEADATLHGILGQFGEASDAMAGKSGLGPREGALKLAAALGEYGERFDHPGWQTLGD